MNTQPFEYLELRPKLIEKGHTFRSWAIANNFPVGSVYAAMSGKRNGIKAVRIRRAIENFVKDVA